MSSGFDTRRLRGAGCLLLCLLTGALYSVHKGQDAIWDLKNYHLYNAWAVLNGRLSIDLAPAGLQSYFNPLLDLPYYLLGSGPLASWPRLLAAVQGLWYGAVIFVLLRITIRLAQIRQRSFGWADLLAVLIGATGTMLVSQTGTSFNELPLLLLVLLALYLLLPLCGSEPVERALRRVLLAGLLCGLAAGLKPTAVVYPPALGLALLLALGGGFRAWRMTLLLAVGALIGFVISYGWWGWQLYRLTGNPVFPMFNQLFHSPWVPASSGTDRQFMPHGLWQWLFYPFYWIGRQHLVSNTDFADARYAAEMLAVCVLLVTGWLSRARPAFGHRAVRLLLVFVAAGYVLWLGLFSILRYALPVEVLSGVLLMLACQAVLSHEWPGASQSRRAGALMLVLFVLMASGSRYPRWGHVPFAGSAFDVQVPLIAPGTLVLVIGQPQAYVIPFMAHASEQKYIGLTWLDQLAEGYQLADRARARITGHIGPVYALLRGDVGSTLPLLRQFAQGAQLDDCRPVKSTLERAATPSNGSNSLRLCRVTRGG